MDVPSRRSFLPLFFLMPAFFARKLLRSGYNVDVCMYLRFVGILANILRLVVEPKRYVLEVIEHPNHSLRI